MPTITPKELRYTSGQAPPIGEQLQDKRSTVARRYKAYKQADDTQRFDIIKDNLAEINFYLSEQAAAVAKGTSQIDLSKLVQLCTALGISYDKLYAKRDTGIKPLSFPEPLLGMVRKGLLLSKGAEVSATNLKKRQTLKQYRRPISAVPDPVCADGGDGVSCDRTRGAGA